MHQLNLQNIINAKNTYKISIKTISCCYILRMLTQEYARVSDQEHMANQSKLQVSLLEMEQHNLLDCYCIQIYAIKNILSKEKTAGEHLT